MPDVLREDALTAFYRLRQMLGWLGLSLPVFLVLGGLLTLGGVEPSISDYYHTLLRDLLVATVAAIGLFLIAYPGHRKGPGEHLSDDLITTLAGIAALGVAFFPNENRAGLADVRTFSQAALGLKLAAICHYASAVVFLSGLSAMCLRKFSRSADPRRRRVYRLCGWVIAAMTACTVAASWFKLRGPAVPQAVVNDLMLVLWFEALAIWAFALAWLVKGRADMALMARLRQAQGRGAA